jgi:hypothetical protein
MNIYLLFFWTFCRLVRYCGDPQKNYSFAGRPETGEVMKPLSVGAALLLGATLMSFPLVSAQAKGTMKECAAEWQKMKAANQTAGKTYREFSKQCMSDTSAAPAAAPAQAAPAPATTTATPMQAPAPRAGTAKAGTKPADGRQAEYARERACGAEWKADKAANKIPAGQKWPQYWSECNKRKKAAGM